MKVTDERAAEIAARCEAATPGSWRAMRDGNQYVETSYLPTAKCVAASYVDGLVRPWNPHAYVRFGVRPQEFETARFLDADADFIAAARTDIPDLHADREELKHALAEAQARAGRLRDALLAHVEMNGGTHSHPDDCPDLEACNDHRVAALAEAALALPAGGTALREALAAARAKALREAADMAHVYSHDTHEADLRRLADEAEAGR